MISPETIDYSSGEWMDKLTFYQVGDLVTCPTKHGEKVLTVTQIRAVRPGDYKFALHTQYAELSDRHGILESNVSAALLVPVPKTENS